jgi:hypothetical protein
VMPLDIAVSQKIRAFMDREMGRDLFDLLSILPRSKPNYHYLEQALKISNPNEIKELILKRCDEINIDRTLSRTEPFLFNPDDVNRIKFFRNFVESYEF